MIAVTGAAGFIGSHLAHRLNSLGRDLVLVDGEITPAKAANLLGLSPCRTLQPDEFVSQLDELRPTAIFHLGACSSTTESNWDYLRRNNIEYSKDLWTWCTQNQRPLIYASSAATYGDGSHGFDDQTPPTSLSPLNLYGKSKNDFDAWVSDPATRAGGEPPVWAGVKFFNVFGPRERHKGRMASVVWQAFQQIQATGEVRLFRSTESGIPDGGHTRDFVFVEDCVDHLLWLWSQRKKGIFNSGTGHPRTFNDLARAVFRALELEPRIRYIDMPADLVGKYQSYTCAAMAALVATGYAKPATRLEDGAAACVNFWREHAEGIDVSNHAA